MHNFRIIAFGIIIAGLLSNAVAANTTNPFIGRWALTTPSGHAAWLEVKKERNYYDGAILWIGGSVVPVSSVFFHEDTMFVTRVHDVRRRDAQGKEVRKQQYTEIITAKVMGDALELSRIQAQRNGEGIIRESFSGNRIPPLSPKPDLNNIKYADTITLFNGADLKGWRLTNTNQENGWFAQQGELRNIAKQTKGRPHISYGNLRTDEEFEDFTLALEVSVPRHGNSGIYLRGIYEVQVADTYGKPLDSHHMGGVYSRIAPCVNAEKPANEWQKFEITLLDRHITVILNGKKIIDNQPLLGCTGGALTSNEFVPGPIYLQGDHTSVKYRNITIRRIVK
jgi:hypothetical protein